MRLLNEEGEETEASKAYAKKMSKRLKDWQTLDRKVYGYLVRACEANASAMEVIMREKLEEAISKDILKPLEERFRQADMVGVIQAMLAAFHSTDINPENIVNRLLNSAWTM